MRARRRKRRDAKEQGMTDINGADLVGAIHSILKQSSEPLTMPKIRARLRGVFQTIRLEDLTDVLQRQVAAQVLVMFPKYRSGQDRYWDRSLREHAKVVLRRALEESAMPWSELRKKFPKYMRHLAESVLNEELARRAIFRHPPTGPRMGIRFALRPPDIRPHAFKELEEALTRLEARGFSRPQAREAFMQLLQEAEWAEDVPSEAVAANAM
jgi:hypothetical protein